MQSPPKLNLGLKPLRNSDAVCEGRHVRSGLKGRCWVTSLTTAIGPVARAEISHELKGAERLFYNGLSHIVETILKALQVDKAIYLEHRLLTTSLYQNTAFETPPTPEHATIIRSLNRFDHAELIDDLPRKGWKLFPFRLVWIIKNVQTDWRIRRDVRRDLALLQASNLTHRVCTTLTSERLERCLELYRRLYLEKYSVHNPGYETGYVAGMMAQGGLKMHVLETKKGEIVAFCATHDTPTTLSVPLLGYDPAYPQAYRLIMTVAPLIACETGQALNWSAGAQDFKRHRGARPHVEYVAVYDCHLPWWRRVGYSLLKMVLQPLEGQLLKRFT